MANFSFQSPSIVFKILYAGPDAAGKSENLRHLHILSGALGDLRTLNLEGEESVFFDYRSPEISSVAKVDPVFRLQELPNKIKSSRGRRLLHDTDAIVFVADSSTAAMNSNMHCLAQLENLMRIEHLDLSKVPLVFQYNKRDLDDVVSVEDMTRLLNPTGHPHFEASAALGDNIEETVHAICARLYEEAVMCYGLVPSIPSPQRHSTPSLADILDDVHTLGEPRPDSDAPAPISTHPRQESSVIEKPATPSIGFDERETVPPSPGAKVFPTTPAPMQTSANSVTQQPEAGSSGSLDPQDLEKRLLAEVIEMRATIHQQVMTQIEQDAFDDMRTELVSNQEQIVSMIARNEELLQRLDGKMGQMEQKIAQMTHAIPAAVMEEVDHYLGTYVEEIARRLSDVTARAAAPKQDLGLELLQGLEEIRTSSRAPRANVKKTTPPPKRATGNQFS